MARSIACGQSRLAPLLALLLLAGCQSVSTRESPATIPAREVDGLPLGMETSATTREILALLDIRAKCGRKGIACAEAILRAEGTVREATRLVAASEVLYLASRRIDRSGPALTQCVIHTHRYLMEPGVPGRRGALDSRTQLALRLHNACTAGLLDLEGAMPARLAWQVDPSAFPIDSVQRLVRADRVKATGLRTRQREDGIGVAAVAFGRTDRQQGSFPAQPFALAVNVRAEPDPLGNGIRFLVTDSSKSSQVTTAFGPADLALDKSAAYAHAAIAFEGELSRWEGLRPSAPGQDMPRIRLLAPVDQKKTPVFLVHGIASSPLTWANLVNELQGDPDIALHYQFWLVRYSTALPLLRNRKLLAEAISGFHQSAIADQAAAPPAVAIGHSMGGVLTRLLVTDSGTALWDAAFVVDPSLLQGTPDDLSAARDVFVFSRLDVLDEVVLIASPHRGSPLASGVFSRLLGRLIRGPEHTVSFLARLALANPGLVRPSVRGSYLSGGPQSLDTMTPTQPVSVAGSQLPVSPGVTVHSIIGIRDARHPEAGDGVVPMASATWPVGENHLVPGDHSVHAAPESISIIKRLLLDRIQRNMD